MPHQMSDKEWRHYKMNAMLRPLDYLISAEEHVARHVGRSWSYLTDRAIARLDSTPDAYYKSASSIPTVSDIHHLMYELGQSPQFMKFFMNNIADNERVDMNTSFILRSHNVTGYGVSWDRNDRDHPFISNGFKFVFKSCDNIIHNGREQPAPFGCGLVTIYALDNPNMVIDLDRIFGADALTRLIKHETVEAHRTVTPTYQEIIDVMDNTTSLDDAYDSFSSIKPNDFTF